MGSPGVDGPGDGARLPCADEGCGQRTVAGLAPAPASAHRIERAGEASRELFSLPRSDMMRICRGSVDGADPGILRPRGSSSTVSVGEGKLGTFGAGVDDPEAGAGPDFMEVDTSIAA